MYVLPGRFCLERAVTRRCREPLAVFTGNYDFTGLALGALSEHGRGTLPRFTVEVSYLQMLRPNYSHTFNIPAVCSCIHTSCSLEPNSEDVKSLSEHGRGTLLRFTVEVSYLHTCSCFQT